MVADSTPVDGITPPAASVPASSSPAMESVYSPRTLALSRVSLIAFALLYTLPALVLFAMFPRVDGQWAMVRSTATLAYIVGGIVLFLALALSLSRIAASKQHPRRKLVAMIRAAIYLVPLLLLTLGVVWKINRAPTLVIDVTSPESTTQLVAPVSVTYALETALTYYRSVGLSPVKYEWDFNGDREIDQESFEPQGTFTYTKAGIYTVQCRITMSTGETKSLSRRLVIPRAGVGVQPTEPIVDEPATLSVQHLFSGLDDKAPKLQNAKWDFDGDGVVDLQTESPTATFTYRRVGPTTVTVTLLLSNQTQQTITRAITVVSPPAQPFPVTMETEPATLLGSPPFGILFALKTREPIAGVQWDFGNRKTAEGLRVAQVFSEPGTFTVTAIVRSQSGATATLTKMVRVTQPLQIPDLSFEGTPPVRSFAIEGRVPLAVDITPTTSLPLVTFSWDVPGLTDVQAAGKSLQGVFRDPGSYVADLIAVDSDQKVFRRRLRINALPPQSLVTFTMTPETPTAPATIRFDASDVFLPGEEITGFEWDFGDAGGNVGTKFTGARTEHLYAKPGTYIITLTVRVTSGKSFQEKKTLLVRAPLMDACFLASRSAGTAPLGVTFDATCSTGDIEFWRWKFGDGSESDTPNPTHVFASPGTYRVTLTVRSAAGMTNEKSATISVTPP